MRKEPSLEELVRTRVRALRKQRGMTQGDLCERAGVSIDAVSRIESGDRVPSLGTLAKLADALDVRVTELVAQSRLPPRDEPDALARLRSLLEREPPEVQRGAAELVKAYLKIAHSMAEFAAPDARWRLRRRAR